MAAFPFRPKYPLSKGRGHIMWSHYGGVYAVFRVKNIKSYQYLSNDEKQGWLESIRRAITVQQRPFYLLSVCEPIDPQLLSDSIKSGLTGEAAEVWAEYAAAMAESVQQQGAWQRHFYVIANLADTRPQQVSNLLDHFLGRLPYPPTEEQTEPYVNTADVFAKSFESAGLTIEPANRREMRWLNIRAGYRGVLPVTLNDIDPDYPLTWPPINAEFDEGGNRSDSGNGLNKRYLRVSTPTGVGYQTFICAAKMPLAWGFPDRGGEWWRDMHYHEYPVDWMISVYPTSNQAARKKAVKILNRLQKEYSEYNDPNYVPEELDRGVITANYLKEELSTSTTIPQLRVGMTFCLYSDDLTDLKNQVDQFRNHWEAGEWSMAQPLADQRKLFLHMLPGGPEPWVVRKEYAQYMLPNTLASGMPMFETEIGDPRGQMFGVDAGGWTNRPVLFAADYAPSINESPSLAAFGGLGSGKSYAIKQIAYGTIARNGRVVCVDRTSVGEYVQFGQAFAPEQTQTVEIGAGANFTMDPCRIFKEKKQQAQFMSGFLRTAIGAESRMDRAAMINEATIHVVRGGGRALDVIDYLIKKGAGGDGEASGLARQVSQLTESEYAQAVLNEHPPLQLNGSWIVFALAGLPLPTAEQLKSEQQMKEMEAEQMIGQALLYIVGGVCRQFCLSDTKQFAATLLDEAWALTKHPGGKTLISELIRDGRKHNAAVWLMSQHPDDLDDSRLLSTIGNRMIFKQGQGAGKKALTFCGINPSDSLVRQVESLPTGMCFWRDVRQRIGLIQVLPVDENSNLAAQTTPVV